VGAWRVDAMAWSEIRKVVAARVKDTMATSKVTVVGTAGTMVISPINSPQRKQLFDALLEAARRRQIAVRTEWEELSD